MLSLADRLRLLHDAVSADLLRARLRGACGFVVGGRYRIERVLGRGASGLVVQATDTRLQRPVALKLRPAVAGDERALTEARMLARVEHPHVVRVHDVDVVHARIGSGEGELWLVAMAFVRGRSMRSWLLERRRSPSEIAHVMYQVAMGLAAVHDAGLLHRDVKPDNVLVREDGVAQVVDFDLGRAGAHHGLADVSCVEGTGPYLAPEARRGRYGTASDQYAFGVTLVEALCGVPAAATRRAPPGVPHGLWSLARRCTRSKPSRRCRDMREVASHLRGIAAQTNRPRRSRRGLLLAVAAATLALVGIDHLARREALLTAALPVPADAASASGVSPCVPRAGAWSLTTEPSSYRVEGSQGPRCRLDPGVYRMDIGEDGGRPTMALGRVGEGHEPIAIRGVRFGSAADCVLDVVAETGRGDIRYFFHLVMDQGKPVAGTFRTTEADGSGCAGTLRVAPMPRLRARATPGSGCIGDAFARLRRLWEAMPWEVP
ncbi:MAG: serine/threonine-protein kinase [Myxococcales bacterium]|nr:serine/threonine-protein kinase [Myxococcales bacterium]